MKVITSKMTKFTDKQNMFTREIIDAVNNGAFDAWIFDPRCIQCDSVYLSALESIIYSIIKTNNTGLASDSINLVADIFGTCTQCIERYMRGMDRVKIDNNCGLDNIYII